MYPGYSPKDIEYGKAAMEAGKAFVRARTAGVKIERDATAPDYKIGQQHGLKRQRIYSNNRNIGVNEGAEHNLTANGQNSSESAESAEMNESSTNKEGQYFVIDTNPTPVNLTIGQENPYD